VSLCLCGPGEWREGIDGPHASAPVHEIQEAIAVKKIYSGELFGLPTPQTEPVLFVRTSGQSSAKQVIGNRLESPAFFNRLLFYFPQELVFDRQCGSSLA
jgi:hypothetical protein